MNEGCRVVGCEASGKMTARRVHGWPTQLGEKGFFNRVKLVAIVKCNKHFFVVVNKLRRVWVLDKEHHIGAQHSTWRERGLLHGKNIL